MTAPWLRSIATALDRAADAGRRIALWWRDDDAVRPTPALERLIALGREAGIPIGLAVVPGRAEPDLAARLAEAPGMRPLVHGFLHRDHAPPGAKAAEFGPHRPLSVLTGEARTALARHRALFGAGAPPVFVPPWNRLDPSLADALVPLGYAGWSGFGGFGAEPTRIDTHIDPIAWRGSRSLVPPEELAATFAAKLAAGGGAPGRPIGLLTHHLAADEAVWRFTAELVGALARHPAVTWPSPESLWGLDGEGGLSHTGRTTRPPGE